MLANTLSFIILYPSIPLAIALFIVLLYVVYLHQKMHRFTRGETGASLETIIKACIDSVAEIEKRNELISKHALSLDTRVSHAIRNVQTARYKAFEVGGSNQSFSIALLNEKGDGVIITSLHARDRISTFAKPITKYGSTYELTDEERSVIEESKNAHKQSH
jgi:hypothetical protein